MRINDLKDILVKEKNRYQAPNIPKIIKKDIKSNIELLEKKIEKLEIELTKIIENRKIRNRINQNNRKQQNPKKEI